MYQFTKIGIYMLGSMNSLRKSEVFCVYCLRLVEVNAFLVTIVSLDDPYND